MKKTVLVFIALFLLNCATSFANNYSTPGTGVHWNLDDLVTNSGGDVTFSEGMYHVNDTVFISRFDTLSILSDATVSFLVGTYMDVNGTLRVNPPNTVLFTAENKIAGYLGLRIDSSNSTSLKKLTFEYAVSLRVTDCNIRIDSCLIQYNNNNPLTNFGNGALSLFRSSPTVTNTRFLNNQRAAIQGGSNINNAPKVFNCLFMGNNITNTNVPQINLGASGTDTTRIINSQFLRSSTNSGAIGFLPSGNVYAVITGNLIKNNRYGITFNGQSNINALVSYNVIDSNNTQGDPQLGGSGISFSGGNSSSHQNVIVTGNLIRWNLWGITIGATSVSANGGAMPNLGNVMNADTSDDGKNQFIENHNTSSTPNIDLYNNNVDSIFAQNNYWGTGNLASIEDRIFHQVDNPALGLVKYLPAIIPLPVNLVQFSVSTNGNDALLRWQTATESNSAYFTIEKSEEGVLFQQCGAIPAKGLSNNSSDYHFTDKDVPRLQEGIFYRLKMVDKDGKFRYSPVLFVKSNLKIANTLVRLYPTVLAEKENLFAEIHSSKAQEIRVRFLGSNGQLLKVTTVQAGPGLTTMQLLNSSVLPAGISTVQLLTAEGVKTFRILKIH